MKTRLGLRWKMGVKGPIDEEMKGSVNQNGKDDDDDGSGGEGIPVTGMIAGAAITFAALTDLPIPQMKNIIVSVAADEAKNSTSRVSDKVLIERAVKKVGKKIEENMTPNEIYGDEVDLRGRNSEVGQRVRDIR